MSARRIAIVISIFILASISWAVLGSATLARSKTFLGRLASQVENLWGVSLTQQAPSLAIIIPGKDQVRWIMPSSNTIKACIQTDYRKKGLIWYPTYICSFDGNYTINNTEETAQKVRLHFDFPSSEGTYNEFSLLINGKKQPCSVNTVDGISEILEISPGETCSFRITYTTRGLKQWQYQPDQHAGRIQNLEFILNTNFEDIDYVEGGLSPMSAEKSGDGMQMVWNASDLITSQPIGIVVPEKLNPGPIATRITFFAPVCLLFFFILVATIQILYQLKIHPMNYLFVAAGFFAFHLLLAFMVGLLNINLAFIIAAIVSIFLVTVYLKMALGREFPWKLATAGQFFFLVLFSYSFFFKGVTGLTVAIGAVVTLGILMKVTAHLDWEEVFANRQTPPVTMPPVSPEQKKRVKSTKIEGDNHDTPAI